jgi:hypothetical protein
VLEVPRLNEVPVLVQAAPVRGSAAAMIFPRLAREWGRQVRAFICAYATA